MRTFTLNNGALMPAIGLGTWQSKPGQVEKAVDCALRHGYRHIDTAYAYGNEKEVGEGISRSGVPREHIWLTTKLDNDWHHRVHEAIDASLRNLGVDYVDLYLMHWPVALKPSDLTQQLEDWDFTKTWGEMQKLLETGKVRNIGVSNFGVSHLEKLLSSSTCQIIPAVNQVELHPLHPSTKLLAYCQSKQIHLTAYCPLGSTNSPLQDNEALQQIAKRHDVPVQLVILAWGVQRGTSILPKSVTRARIEENFAADDWELPAKDMSEISKIQDRFKVTNDEWLPCRVFLRDDE